MLDMESLDRVASALESSLAANDLTEYYTALRASELPFVAVNYGGDTFALARACRDILHRLGGLSPAVALAFENHLFVTAALATFSVNNEALEAKARAILEKIGRERLLVANTSSRVHANKLNALGTLAKREGDGFRISGSAAYTSLSTQSDLLLFMTRMEDGRPALFIAPLKNQPEIEIGPYLFPRAMIESDTRRIEFHDLFVPEDSLLQGGQGRDMLLLNQFELTWHLTMIPALYLGAAARAIEEARKFLRSVNNTDGKPLSELDGMIVDVGRLAIRYRTARKVLDYAVEELGQETQNVLEPELVRKGFERAAETKYVGTSYAEEIVTQARRIVGARSFTAGQALERLSMESLFGTLGPEPGAYIERLIGAPALGEQPFRG
jgi:alkylation response protein AidB-like acyl-CoA dehydrogenase